MGILSKIINQKLDDRIPVFGTQSYIYNSEEFDRLREDGISVIDLMPECRVFIGGSEITKDVISVNVNHGICGSVGTSGTGGGSSCTIAISNPRGKFEITKQDLTGKWREDKDILAMYDYDYLTKDPGFDLQKSMWKFLESQELNDTITNTIGGLSGNGTIGALGGSVIAKGIQAAKNKQKVMGTTRMLFETKHASGLYKRIGDLVFDYKDPVYVFMKGRFSSLWYFAFSGFVTTWDENDTYGDSNTINLKCESILYLLKKTKVQERAALYPAGNFETALMSANTATATALYDSVASESITQMIKAVIYGRDYYKSVQNSHISSDATIYPTTADYEHSYIGGVTTGLDALRNKYPVFKDKFNFSSVGKASDGSIDLNTVKISDIKGTAGGPNSLPLSHWQQTYFQYNEISMEKTDNLHYYFRDSVRFWEKNHKISDTPNDGTYTGWQDTDAFGVLGVHPALTYQFINNFNILPSIWKEISDSVTKVSTKLDGLVLSPYDKLVEAAAGSATEASIGKNMGSNLNSFRPRIFTVLPKKFKADHPVQANAFGAMQLLKESASTAYDILAKLSGLDYTMYSTPMGDIIIEPSWYDTHPTDHWPMGDPIVLRNSTKTTQVKTVRQYDTNKDNVYNDIKAYDYKENNNHPYFIMQKDVARLTQTFSPELIKTKVIVRGSTGAKSAAAESIALGADIGQLSVFGLGKNTDSSLQQGFYVADGFKDKFRRVVASFTTLQDIFLVQANKAFKEYTLKIFFSRLNTIANLTLYEFYDTFFKSLVTSNQALLKAYKNNKDILPFGMTCDIIDMYLHFLYDEDNLARVLNPASDDPWVATTMPSTTKMIDYDFFYSFFRECIRAFRQPINVATTTESPLNVATTLGSILYETTKTGEITYDSYLKSYTEIPQLREIINLYTFGLIYGCFDAGQPTEILEARRLLKLVYDLDNKTKDVLSVRTMGDLKKLAEKDFYDPQLDIVRRYGWNSNMEEVTNMYVKNGREATYYASVIFQKLFSGAFTLSLDTIGRPEYQLNRTYYCQRKDAIGLMTKYTLGWSNASDFSSQVDLTHIRKNALTYMYSLGTLDIINSKSENNNKSFQKEAETYYKWKKLSTMLVNKTAAVSNALATGAASAAGIPGSAVVGEEISGVAASLLSRNLSKLGGMYSVHGPIGHLDYDLAAYGDGEDAAITAAKNLSADAESISYIYKSFFSTSDTDDNIGLNFAVLQKLNVAIDKAQNACIKTFTSYAAAKAQLDTVKKNILEMEKRSTGVTQQTDAQRRRYAQYRKLHDEKITIESKLKNDVSVLAKHFETLYGPASAYANVISKNDKTYDTFISTRFQSIASSQQVSNGPKIKLSKGREVSSEVSALSEIQKSIGITSTIMNSQVNAFYNKLIPWLSPNATLLPDRLSALEVGASTFGSFGTIATPYFKQVS